MGKIKLTFIIISAILLAIIVFLLLANFVYKPKALTSSLFIYFCKKGDTVRDAGLTTPEGIIRFDDIQYEAAQNGTSLMFTEQMTLHRITFFIATSKTRLHLFATKKKVNF